MTSVLEPECDLIMKGGITSGVVYPHAIQKVASKYRLRSIGGTSAGAIAASFAAAAEFRRQENAQTTAGFDEIGSVADELGSTMFGLFQPTRATKPLFDLLLAAIDPDSKGGIASIFWAIPKAFYGQVIFGVFLILLSVFAGYVSGNFALGALGVLVSLLATVILIVLALKKLVLIDLPAQDFGLCTGKTQAGAKQLAFGDWIAHKIDLIAGKTDAPLTVRDLRKHGIAIAAMTTDISSQRPYRLPMETSIHFFSKAEFEKIFPEKIMTYLCDLGARREPLPDDRSDLPKDLYQLPVGDDFPVYLVARISLSVPGLINAVPLWRIDYTSPQKPFRRCLFSDGAISSNFPIHFFDAILPSRPTFGIALDAYDEERHDARVKLPTRPSQSTAMPIAEITSLSGLLSSVLDTAMNWQDKMQSMLPGYAERIVKIRLDEENEGGLNLSMEPETIAFLGELGGQAGDTLLSEFKMNDQKLHRARSILPTLEGALAGMATAYDEDYAEVMVSHKVKKGTENWRADPFAKLAESLSQIGAKSKELHEDPTSKSVRQGDVPHADAEVRLVALADRIPKGMEGTDYEDTVWDGTT